MEVLRPLTKEELESISDEDMVEFELKFNFHDLIRMSSLDFVMAIQARTLNENEFDGDLTNLRYKAISAENDEVMVKVIADPRHALTAE